MVWAASMGTMGTMPGSLRQQFEAEGYVLLRGGIPQPLLRALQAAVQPLLAAHFAGETGSQRHQTILEPNFFQPEFLEFLNLETLNHAAAEIIGVDHPASLSFSGLALLMGHTEPTALNWHRDFGDDHPESPHSYGRDPLALSSSTAHFLTTLRSGSCRAVITGHPPLPSSVRPGRGPRRTARCRLPWPQRPHAGLPGGSEGPSSITAARARTEPAQCRPPHCWRAV